MVEDRPVSSVSRRGRSQPSCCTSRGVEGNFCVVDVVVIDTKYVTMVTGGSRVEDEVLAVDGVLPTKQIVVDASTGMGKSHVGDQGGYLWRRAGGERAASVCGQWGGSGTGEGAWAREEGRKEEGGGNRYEVLVYVDRLCAQVSLSGTMTQH